MNAKLGFTLVLLHPAFLYSFSPAIYISAIKDYSIFGWLGPLALNLFLIVIITSIFREKIKLSYERWRKVHLLVYLGITLGFVHGYMLGQHTRITPYFVWYLLHLGVVTFAFVYRYLIVPKLKTYKYEVVSVAKEAENIYSVSLKPKGARLTHKAGQFAFVRFLSSQISDEEHHFTISSHPDSKYLTFTIDGYGDYTKDIHKLAIGDQAILEAPFGDLVPDGSREYLFVAGGIGITPIMSIVRHLIYAKSKSKVKLLYSGKTIKKMAFVSELLELHKKSLIDLQLFTTEELNKLSNNSRIDKYTVQEAYKSMENPSVYVVGPQALIDTVSTSLRPKTVKRERFAFN